MQQTSRITNVLLLGAIYHFIQVDAFDTPASASSTIGRYATFHAQRSLLKTTEWKNTEWKDQVDHEICSRSIDRLLHDNIDFNEVLEANTGEWTDTTFTFPDAIFWKDMRPTHPSDNESGRSSDTQWLRISDVFNTDEFSLWGSEEISPKDTI